VVISVEAAPVDNATVLDCLPFEVALEEPEIGGTNPNIPIDNCCKDDELHFGMPGGSRDHLDEVDETNEHDAISTASRRQKPATELERFDLGTCNLDRYEGEDGNDADADGDEEEEASQAVDGSTQNVEDWGHSTRECEDWTVYFRLVKYDHGEANTMASDLSEAKTVFQQLTKSQS